MIDVYIFCGVRARVFAEGCLGYFVSWILADNVTTRFLSVSFGSGVVACPSPSSSFLNQRGFPEICAV